MNSEQKRLDLSLENRAEFNVTVLMNGPTLMSGLRLCNDAVLNTLAVLVAADCAGFGPPHMHTLRLRHLMQAWETQMPLFSQLATLIAAPLI